MDEELDSLREKSTRASSVYDDLERDTGGTGFITESREHRPLGRQCDG